MKKAIKLNVVSYSLAAIAAIGIAGSTIKSTPSAIRLSNGKYAVQNNGTTFYSSYGSDLEVRAAGEKLNREIADESFTLLKNKDNTLPLEGATNVSVFGKNSINPGITGGGSGGGKGGTAESVDVYKSLEEAGFNVNPVLKAFYEDDARSGAAGTTGGMGGSSLGNTIGETAWTDYDAAVKHTFSNYNDAAIIFLKRSGSEGADNARNNVKDHVGDTSSSDKHYQELSDNEKEMISEVKKAGFKKIVVVLNTPSVMEVKDLQNDDAIGGILWSGVPGDNGFAALGRILNGTVNPSGRLVDIWASDLRKDPTWFNFGDGSQGTDKGSSTLYSITNKDTGKKLSEEGTANGIRVTDYSLRYEEGVYMGYRYYETVAADLGANGEAWYNTAVTYPFGYGLSYTTFTYNTTQSNQATFDYTTGELRFNVEVTNSGKVAGKDVVSAYFKAPYIDGGIEKADRVLAAYGKTKLLAPGEKETVTLSFYLQDMANYDYDDKNKDSHTGYELDKGDYKVTINTDSHTEEATFTFNAANIIHYDTNRLTGAKVENQFTGGAFSSLPDPDSGYGFEPMTRAGKNLQNKLPDAPTAEDLSIDPNSAMYKQLNYVFQLTDLEKDQTSTQTAYGVTDPRRKTEADVAGFSQADESVTTPTSIQFKDIAGISFDDPRWDEILNSLKWSEMTTMHADGGWHNPGLERFGMSQGIDKDGPSGTGLINYCAEVNIASTWNVDLATEFGAMMGEEALWTGINGWYAPAADTHRSAFAGRNFEYYSEDPVISGTMLKNTVAAAQEKGVYAYVKHFALNDQETSRSGISTFVSEQALREIYLKAFEPAFTEAHAMGMMGGMNRIGVIDNYGSPALMINVLRNEWGFKGLAETDAYFGGDYKTSTYGNPAYLTVSGINMTLGSVTNRAYFGEYKNGKVMIKDKDGNNEMVGNSVWVAVRDSVKYMLYTFANSNKVVNGLDVNLFGQNNSFTTAANIDINASIAVDKNALGTKNVNYTLDSDSTLPDGLVLNKDGSLSGKISQAGTYTFNATMHADGWISRSKTFTITVNPMLEYSGDDLSKSEVGKAVSGSVKNDYIKSKEEDPSSKYDTVKYALKNAPSWLAISDDGKISGTPTESGTFNFQVEISASYKQSSGWGGVQTRTDRFTQDFALVVQGNEQSEEDTIKDLENKIDDLTQKLTDAETKIDSIQTGQGQKAEASNNGLAIAALVIGILAIVGLGCGAAVFLFKKK